MEPQQHNPSAPQQEQHTPVPHLGILFECCNVYRYIYKRKDGTAYDGMCPRCGRRVVVPIDPHGTSWRIFRAR